MDTIGGVTHVTPIRGLNLGERLKSLPVEVALHILEELPLRDLAIVARRGRFFNRLCKDVICTKIKIEGDQWLTDAIEMLTSEAFTGLRQEETQKIVVMLKEFKKWLLLPQNRKKSASFLRSQFNNVFKFFLQELDYNAFGHKAGSISGIRGSAIASLNVPPTLQQFYRPYLRHLLLSSIAKGEILLSGEGKRMSACFLIELLHILERPCKYVVRLALKDFCLDDAEANMIGNLLERRPIHTLDLSGNQLTITGLKRLCAAITIIMKKSLRDYMALVLSGNPIDDSGKTYAQQFRLRLPQVFIDL